MSYINQTEYAPVARIQDLDICEINQVNGGSRVQLVIKVIDWVGRALTVQTLVENMPEVDLEEFGRREAARRPGAGG